MAEQLRLHQGLGEGGAVDGHVGALGAGAGLVDGPGHQLLPGPALPGEEDRGRRGGHLGGPGQGVLEGGRPAENPVEAVPVPELLPEPGDPLLQLAGPALDAGALLLLLGQPLVLDGHHELGRNGGGDLHIRAVVPVGAPLGQAQGPADILTEPEWDGQAGAVPPFDHAAITRTGGIQLRRGVTDKNRVAGRQLRRKGEILEWNPGRWGRIGRFVHLAHELQIPPVFAHEAHSHGIEVQNGSDRVRHLFETLLDVQAGAENAGQPHKSGQMTPAALLTMEENDVFDEWRDQIGDVLGHSDLRVGVRIGREAPDEEGPDDPPAAAQWDVHPRPQANRHWLGLMETRLGKPRIRLEVPDTGSLTGKHPFQDQFSRCVTTARVEGNSIPALVNGCATTVVLCKDGERPPLFQICNHHAIVGNQPLDLCGELREKALRIEDLLHGTTDRGQGSQQVRLGKFELHSASVIGARQGIDIPAPLPSRRATSEFMDSRTRPYGCRWYEDAARRLLAYSAGWGS